MSKPKKFHPVIMTSKDQAEVVNTCLFCKRNFCVRVVKKRVLLLVCKVIKHVEVFSLVYLPRRLACSPQARKKLQRSKALYDWVSIKGQKGHDMCVCVHSWRLVNSVHEKCVTHHCMLCTQEKNCQYEIQRK